MRGFSDGVQFTLREDTLAPRPEGPGAEAIATPLGELLLPAFIGAAVALVLDQITRRALRPDRLATAEGDVS